MSIQVKKLHAALKHGAYSATAVLPGEDLAAFKKLHQECIAHYAPVGPLEDDVVATMARLLADGNRVMRGMSEVPNHPTKLPCLMADYADCRTEILMITAIRDTLVHRVSLMHAMG